jgi:hypothetical protein
MATTSFKKKQPTTTNIINHFDRYNITYRYKFKQESLLAIIQRNLNRGGKMSRELVNLGSVVFSQEVVGISLLFFNK